MDNLQVLSRQEQPQNNLQRSRGTDDKIQRCLTECPNEESFFKKYSMGNVIEYCQKYRDRMIVGNAPTLSTIRYAYGDATILDYLNFVLLDLANFSGFGEKVTGMQIDGMSQTLLSKYHYLKVTELMLFVYMAKAGELRDRQGNNVFKFYGTFSGDVISSSMNVFMEHRNKELYEEECKKEQANKDNWVAAKSELIAPLLKKMREEWEFNAMEKAKAADKEKQRIIDEHNEMVRKMGEARQAIQ